MRHRNKRQRLAGLALIVCILSLALCGCAPAAEGAAMGGDVLYALDAQKMTGTELHTAELRGGDVLRIRFETVKGSLYMEIKAPDGTVVYGGNGTEAEEFTVNIREDGVYAFRVEAKQARGNISVAAEINEKTEIPETVPAPEPTPPPEPETDAQSAAVAAEDLIGPWHLMDGEIDDAVNEAIPGAMEFGSSMEITGDGKISWYIGADGAFGTYTLDGNVLSADMTRDSDGTALPMELTAERDGGRLLLTMDYKGLTLRWAWGEGETGKGEEF